MAHAAMVSALVVTAVGCAPAAAELGASASTGVKTDPDMSQGAAQADALGDGTWTLRVDREWDRVSGNIRHPSDPLEEADYRPVTDGSTYPVTVTDAVAIVSVGAPPMSGARDMGRDDRYYYDLTEGAFAGGRFVVWVSDGGLQAELTIYGSGVPIVRSERGSLEPLGSSRSAFLPMCERPRAR
jgi:hypothetical protein